uniref:Alkaline ceramidase n=1 Tax=Corethrella appendiculata TaxID=1370023 RepID=U5EWL1_9DIPT
MRWEHLEYNSSPVDWCENNYVVSSNIAEFVNTISNIFFLLGPPILIYLFKDYGKFIHPVIHVIWVLLIVVGLSSAYFHATLSLIGQLLDEISILWVFMVTLTFFCPRRYFPSICNNSRKKFSTAMGTLSCLCTILSFWKPAINNVALFALVVPALYLMSQELKRVKDKRVYRLGIRSISILFLAILCWVNDRLFCATWSAINFPYLHGFWHIFIFIAAYCSCVLFAYFFVSDEYPGAGKLKYWPNNEFEFGVPYISVCSYKKIRDNI